MVIVTTVVLRSLTARSRTAAVRMPMPIARRTMAMKRRVLVGTIPMPMQMIAATANIVISIRSAAVSHSRCSRSSGDC